jgi:hypothetical protein
VKVPVVKTVPVAAATRPVDAVPPAAVAAAYGAALGPYLKAQALLAADSAEGVPALVEQIALLLKPVAATAEISADFTRLSDAAAAAKGQPIKDLRKGFKEVSAAMFAIGKSVGLPLGGPTVQAFRCPMVGAPWLQKPGEKMNPYMGPSMQTCGDDAGLLPVFKAGDSPATRPVVAGGRVLAVPRSAVIDTGRTKVVYVRSALGVYDMHAVKLGPPAGDYYPVFEGLDEGQSVVTVGAFLVDAENRLNPSKMAAPSDEHGGHSHEPPAAPMGGMKM